MIRMAGFIFGLFAMGWATGMGCAPHTKSPLTIENAAAVAQYDAALAECLKKAKPQRSLDLYIQCEDAVTLHFCAESPALRKEWPRCKEVLP